VGADVAHAARRPAALRIGAPLRLLLAGALDGVGKPALGVLDDDLADRAERPVADESRACFTIALPV
jgi:hypothetical protein